MGFTVSNYVFPYPTKNRYPEAAVLCVSIIVYFFLSFVLFIHSFIESSSFGLISLTHAAILVSALAFQPRGLGYTAMM